MDRQAGALGGKRGCSRIQLDAFRRPAHASCEMHEAPGMRTNVQQAAPPNRSFVETVENGVKDEVFVAALELVLHPVGRPELIVEQVEEPWQSGQPFRLCESTCRAATKPYRLPGIRCHLRVLIAVQLEIENCVVFARERVTAAHPAGNDGNEPGVHHDAPRSAISRAISSQLRALSVAPNARVWRVKSSAASRQCCNRAHRSAALSGSSRSKGASPVGN